MADKYDYYMKEVALLSLKKPEAVKSSGKTDADPKPDHTDPKNFDPIKTGAILDKLGLTRYCCRRHMLTTVDMMDVI